VEEEKGKNMLAGMLGDDMEPGIRPITINAPPRNSPGYTVELEDQDFENQYAEQLEQVDPDSNTITLSKLEGANDPAAQGQKEDQADNAHVDW